MINYPIKKTEAHASGYICHEMVDGSVLKYSDVRAGLMWPSPKSPAYYCVLAEEYIGILKDPENPYHRGKLNLIAEREFKSLSIEKLCKSIYDDADLLTVRSVYCDLDEDQAEYYDSVRDYGSKMKLKSLRFEDAPFKNNFQAGLAIVNDWGSAGLVSLPDSEARDQARAASDKALDQTDAEFIYYAANALRYAVTGFFRYRPTCYAKTETFRAKNRRGMVV